MIAAMPPRLHITPEALRLAWQGHHRRGWPATFEAAMAHPLYSRLVRTLAIRNAQAQAQRAGTTWPQPGSWRAPHRRQPGDAFDPKAAAANDRAATDPETHTTQE